MNIKTILLGFFFLGVSISACAEPLWTLTILNDTGEQIYMNIANASGAGDDQHDEDRRNNSVCSDKEGSVPWNMKVLTPTGSNNTYTIEFAKNGGSCSGLDGWMNFTFWDASQSPSLLNWQDRNGYNLQYTGDSGADLKINGNSCVNWPPSIAEMLYPLSYADRCDKSGDSGAKTSTFSSNLYTRLYYDPPNEPARGVSDQKHTRYLVIYSVKYHALTGKNGVNDMGPGSM